VQKLFLPTLELIQLTAVTNSLGQQ